MLSPLIGQLTCRKGYFWETQPAIRRKLLYTHTQKRFVSKNRSREKKQVSFSKTGYCTLQHVTQWNYNLRFPHKILVKLVFQNQLAMMILHYACICNAQPSLIATVAISQNNDNIPRRQRQRIREKLLLEFKVHSMLSFSRKHNRVAPFYIELKLTHTA
jgi:hypothetical protein